MIGHYKDESQHAISRTGTEPKEISQVYSEVEQLNKVADKSHVNISNTNIPQYKSSYQLKKPNQDAYTAISKHSFATKAVK